MNARVEERMLLGAELKDALQRGVVSKGHHGEFPL